MPTRKVGEVDRLITCHDPDHDVSVYRYFSPGRYSHECPRCHRVIYFTVYPTFMSHTVEKVEDRWRHIKQTGITWFQAIGQGVK
jgi:hypothetical protein